MTKTKKQLRDEYEELKHGLPAAQSVVWAAQCELRRMEERMTEIVMELMEEVENDNNQD